jgi:hypothetical protein
MLQTSLVSNETTHTTSSYATATPDAAANTSDNAFAAAAASAANTSDYAFAAVTSAANTSDDAFAAAASAANTSDYGTAPSSTLDYATTTADDTNAATKSLFERIELDTEAAAEVLKNIYKKQRSAKMHLNKGLLNEIIEKAKIKHGLDEDVIIC